LTTNRPGYIDDSFISRITCPIAYHTLSLETKGKIVQKFVKRFEETGNIVIEPTAARYLISHCKELNGRQLRNVLQNAVATAEIRLRDDRRFEAGIGREELVGADEVIAKVHHVKAAVERQNGFQEYLKQLRGRNEDTRARNKHDYLSVPPGSPGLAVTM
jgi:DNA-binding NtrC family response regulator